MRKSRGFTLIEMVVTVAIIGILLAISIPSYQNHVRKGRRAEAQTFLMQVVNRQQQYLLDARAYAPTLADLSLNPPATVSEYYTVTVTPVAGPPPGFTVTAVPKGAQVEDGTLGIDDTGVKTRMVASTDKGW